MELIITKNDLTEQPCDRYSDLPFEFDAIVEIKKRGGKIEDYTFLIINCKKAQTPKMLHHYLSLKPDYSEISWFICRCRFAQTPEMIDFYISLKPDYEDVNWFIDNSEFAAENPELNAYLKTLKN